MAVEVDPEFFKSVDDCPDVAKHTKCPKPYLAWMEWAEKKSKTHESTQCPTCGYWAIWLPKGRAGMTASDVTETTSREGRE